MRMNKRNANGITPSRHFGMQADLLQSIQQSMVDMRNRDVGSGVAVIYDIRS
jgi:hypothetical protein